MPISRKVADSTVFRPNLSPIRPKAMPPKGRARKPTAKVAIEAKVAVVGLLAGKNSLPKTSAAIEA